MPFYQIDGTIVYSRGKYRTTHQIPTFFLDGDIQGIIDEKHAVNIAGRIVEPTDNPNIEVNLRAIKIEK